MLVVRQPSLKRARGTGSLARAGSLHTAGKLATLPGSRPRGRTAELRLPVRAGVARVPSANSQTRGEAGKTGRGTRGPARRRGGPAETHPAESHRVGAVRPDPGPREQAQLQSLCLAQRSGRPVPRRPLRAQLSLSMLRAPRCPERAPRAGDSACRRAQPGLDLQAVPGGTQGTGQRESRARQQLASAKK